MAREKCDAVLTALVVKRMAQGAPLDIACAAEGVSRQNVEQWRARADAGSEPHLHFVAEVTRARARFISQRVTNIAEAGFVAGDDGGGDWKADAWLAERLDPEHFAPSQTIVLKAKDEAVKTIMAALQAGLAPAAFAEVVSVLGRDDEGDAEHVEH